MRRSLQADWRAYWQRLVGDAGARSTVRQRAHTRLILKRLPFQTSDMSRRSAKSIPEKSVLTDECSGLQP